MWNCIRLQQWGRRKSSRNWNSSVQNVFFLPADFLRLRCSSKRCGRRVLEDLAQMPLSLVTAFKSKAKKKKWAWNSHICNNYVAIVVVHPMNAKFTLEKLRKKYRMFSTRFASFKTIVGNVSIGITENAFFSDLIFHNVQLVHQQFKIPRPNFNKCISSCLLFTN